MSFARPLLVGLLLLAVCAFFFSRLRPQVEEVRHSRIIMGTVVEIVALGPDSERLEEAVAGAFAEMTCLERLLSPHEPDSDVTRLSAAADAATIAPETAEVLSLALAVAERTGGAFDPTLGRLKELWGIETDRPRVPEGEEIRRALAGTGPGALAVHGLNVEKGAPDLAVDLGGIAKGYAVDRAAQTLLRSGVKTATVNAGGDLRLIGDRNGLPWRIGIQHPRKPQEVLAILPLADRAVVTSGDYERYFEREGVRYHHIFDPRTGYPARGCQSVTVVAGSAAQADAMATAAFVLGPVEGLALLEQTPGVEGLLVAADGKVLITSGLAGRVQWP